MGKYLKTFDTEEEFLDFKNSEEFFKNTISYVKEDGTYWFGTIKRVPSDIRDYADSLITTIINKPV